MLDKEFIDWIKPEVDSLFACQKGLNLPTFQTRNGGHHLRRKTDYIFKTKKGLWGCIEFEPGESYGEITKGATQLHHIFLLLKKGQYFEINGKYKFELSEL